MNNRARCLLILFLCLAAALPAGGAKEKAPVVQVTGRVRLVGSAPMPELVITGPDREWYVERKEEHKLHDLQQRTVTVEGEETVVQLKFANGMSAGERRTLKNIKVIAVE
jgi:hypothetical protein